MGYKNSFWKKNKKPIGIIGVLFLLGLGAYFLFFAGAGTQVALSESSISLSAKNPFLINGEDVSWVDVEIYTPKAGATFSNAEDRYTSSKFELTRSGQASALTLDLTAYEPGVWIKIADSNSYFAEDWHFIQNTGENKEIPLTVYHRPSDVNFNNLLSTTMAAGAPGETDGNYTITADFPRYSTNQLHYGTNWDTITTEFNDMSTKDQEKFYDQRNWRTAAPVYVLTDDTVNTYDSLDASMTSTLGFKFTANTTISTVDGNVAQINFTIADSFVNLWDYQISGTYIYLYSLYSVGAPLTVDYEIQTAVNITISNMHSGWCSIPGLSVTSFSALSAIGA